MNRRKFLKASGGIGIAGLGAWSDLTRTLAAASLERPKAAGEDYRALVCLFLFGGNDANNMVVPTSATEYSQYVRTVPTTVTRAPDTGTVRSSTTVPVIGPDCAWTGRTAARPMRKTASKRTRDMTTS